MSGLYAPDEGDPDDKLERQRAHEDTLVAIAMDDILHSRFDTDAVQEVMQRRAGTISDYHDAKERLDLVVMAARHCGV